MDNFLYFILGLLDGCEGKLLSKECFKGTGLDQGNNYQRVACACTHQLEKDHCNGFSLAKNARTLAEKLHKITTDKGGDDDLKRKAGEAITHIQGLFPGIDLLAFVRHAA